MEARRSCLLVPLGLLAGLGLVVYLSFFVYQPDRPVATIVPGSSTGPAFVVQIIRPRLALPLGGIVPPRLFGIDGHIGFESESAGAFVGSVGPRRLELGADDWDLVLVMGADGQLAPESKVAFELMFEERQRRVLCRPGNPAVGTLTTAPVADSGELSGRFDVELARCEHVETGEPLGWPTKPLVLHGSFDRLPQGTGAKRP